MPKAGYHILTTCHSYPIVSSNSRGLFTVRDDELEFGFGGLCGDHTYEPNLD